MTVRNPIKNFDIWLLAVTLFVLGAGITVLYSATYRTGEQYNYPLKQSCWALVGLLALLLGLSIDYRIITRFAYILYTLNITLLVLVLISGRVIMGAQRWLHIGGFSIQPSELVKVTIIIALARFLTDRKEHLQTRWCLTGAFMLVFLPMVLVIRQPDLGTGLLMIPVLLAMLYIAGVPSRYLWKILIAGLLLSPLLLLILEDYQKTRLLVFLNPDADPLGDGYAINQAKIAIGSGGFSGKGYLQGTQTQLHFLPENRTDFIFATVGEEFGFAGSLLLLGTYGFMVLRGLQISQQARDMVGTLLASGISVLIGLHVFINIGMATGIMPVVGLPLPLISYGGSSMVSILFSIGLLMNVKMRRFTF